MARVPAGPYPDCAFVHSILRIREGVSGFRKVEFESLYFRDNALRRWNYPLGSLLLQIAQRRARGPNREPASGTATACKPNPPRGKRHAPLLVLGLRGTAHPAPGAPPSSGSATRFVPCTTTGGDPDAVPCGCTRARILRSCMFSRRCGSEPSRKALGRCSAVLLLFPNNKRHMGTDKERFKGYATKSTITKCYNTETHYHSGVDGWGLE